MSGNWSGTGFQPVSGPSLTGRMPAPQGGRHQFPDMSQNGYVPKAQLDLEKASFRKTAISLGLD